MADKLKFNGHVLVSIPNISHIDIILNLLEGRFNYSEYGILDNTHLRFFTKRSFGEWIFSINESFSELDFQFDLQHIGNTRRISQYVNDITNKYPLIYYFVSNNVSDFDVLQHIFMLTKIDKADIPYGLKEFLSKKSENIIEKIDAFNNDVYMRNLEISIKEKNAYVENLEKIIKEKNIRIKNLEERDATLNSIYNSQGWRFLSIYYKVKEILFPQNTVRRLIAKITVKAILHPTIFFKKLSRQNLRNFIHHYRNYEPALIEEKVEQKLREGTVTSAAVNCDDALIFSDVLEVSGWAISKEGIDRVEVYCDGVFLGNALYGLPRTDIQSIFSAVKNSLNSGFFFHTVLQNNNSFQGSHSVYIKAITTDGKSAEVIQSVDGRNSYRNYLAKIRPTEETLLWMRDIYKNFSVKPLITVALKVTKSEYSLLFDSIDSIKAQTYPSWNIALFCEQDMPEEVLKELKPLIDNNKLKIYTSDEINRSLSGINCDFLCFLYSGDLLMPDALFEMVKKINMGKGLELIYTDEDVLVERRRQNPFFKPDWSPDLLLSMNYIGGFFFLKKELFDKLGGLSYGYSPEGIYDLLLKVAELTQNIGHLSSILYTKGNKDERSPDIEEKVIKEALTRRGIRGEVVPLNRVGSYRIKREIIGNPKVSIIIPTAYSKPDFLKTCLGSIVEKSTYKNYEIMLIDNSKGKLPVKDFERIMPSAQVRFIEYKEKFNYSRINNIAVKKAEGEYFIFLNDDTEVITPDWIESMLEHAQRLEVGVVGAKLLYHNEGVQHGGILLVDYGGGARHAFRFFPMNSTGYCGLLEINRNCSAVTFACVMVSRQVFNKLGGLDEKFRVECNDVDFCLRAIKSGYSVVWTPFALLFHKELTTRGPANVLEDVNQFWERWRPLLERGDTYYNPNLTLDSDNFSINKRMILIEHHEPSCLANNPLEIRQNDTIVAETIKKILVVKLDHIGDVILSLPAIKVLRHKFPQAHITMIVGSWAKTITEKISDLDEVLTFDFFDERSERGVRHGKKELESLRGRLKSYNFDLAIDLRKNPETRDMLKLSGAKYTAGFSTGNEPAWLSLSINLNRLIENIPGQKNKPHITSQLCELVNAIPSNIRGIEKIEVPEFRDKTIFPDRYSSLLQAGFLVGIHPGVGNAIKQWPIPYFARLMDIIFERINAKMIIFGGKTDQKAALEILNQVRSKDNVISIAGETSIDEFIAIVQKCSIFIGNDSGPCHITGFLGIPTLAIFSGHVSPYEWHPLGQKTLSIRVDLPCAPCYKAKPEQCPYDLKCLKFLWPEKVWEAVQQLMAISGK